MSLAWVVFEVVLNFYDAAFLMSISTVHIERKSWVKRYHIILAWITLSLIFVYINYSTLFSLASIFLFPAFAFLYILIFLQGPIENKVFWLLFPCALSDSVDLFSFFAVSIFAQESFPVVFSQNTYRITAICIMKSIVSLLWFWLTRRTPHKVTKKDRRVYIIICCFCFCLLLFVFYMVVITLTSFTLINQYIMVLFLIIVFLSVMLLYVYSRGYEDNHQFHDELQIKDKNLEVISQNQQALKTLCHSEIVNAYKAVRELRVATLTYLKDLWPLTGRDNPNFLQQYAESFEQINQNLQTNFDLGDELCDIVIAVKEMEAFKFGIALTLVGKIPADHGIYSEDLCILLDYLFTLAIEEVAKISEPDAAKAIELEISEHANTLTLHISYPAATEQPNFDKSYIQDIVGKYGGEHCYLRNDLYNEHILLLPVNRVKPATISRVWRTEVTK